MTKAVRNNTMKYSINDLIESNYMENRVPYRRNYKETIKKKYNLANSSEAAEFIKSIFRIELGYFDNTSFFDLIPKDYSSNVITISYLLAMEFIRSTDLYKTNIGVDTI